jgi:hypothetical protein
MVRVIVTRNDAGYNQCEEEKSGFVEHGCENVGMEKKDGGAKRKKKLLGRKEKDAG